MIMQEKIKKIIVYIVFSAMIAIGFYAIFLKGHSISDKRYFAITAAMFALVGAAFLAVLLSFKMQGEKRTKFLIMICAVLVLFQVLTLPAVNLFSQTLPVWPPRGTIYQVAGDKNSISQNEVALVMRYYLKGKTLYANEDYPLNSHNGEIFITDEYEFVRGDYPTLTPQQGEDFALSYDKNIYSIYVQENPKLNIRSFYIRINTDSDAPEIILLSDERDNWYFMTPDIYEEAFGE